MEQTEQPTGLLPSALHWIEAKTQVLKVCRQLSVRPTIVGQRLSALKRAHYSNRLVHDGWGEFSYRAIEGPSRSHLVAREALRKPLTYSSRFGLFSSGHVFLEARDHRSI